MMVRFSPAGAFCASARVAVNPVTTHNAQLANPRRVNMESSPIRLCRDSIRLATSVKRDIAIPEPGHSRAIGNAIGALGSTVTLGSSARAMLRAIASSRFELHFALQFVDVRPGLGGQASQELVWP